MRRTGKLYTLTICSALLSVFANAMVSTWGDHTSSLGFWVQFPMLAPCFYSLSYLQLDVVPQGFGMSSLITTTLIAVIATVTKEDMAVATGSPSSFSLTASAMLTLFQSPTSSGRLVKFLA
jgi:hypothetical protein